MVLGRGADTAVGSQAGEKAGNLRLAHLSRMALVVEQDKTLDPTDISVFGFDAVVPRTNRFPYLIEELGFGRACLSALTDHFEFVVG